MKSKRLISIVMTIVIMNTMIEPSLFNDKAFAVSLDKKIVTKTDTNKNITKIGLDTKTLKNVASKDENLFSKEMIYSDKTSYSGKIPRINVKWSTNVHTETEHKNIVKKYTVTSQNVDETLKMSETINGHLYNGTLNKIDVKYKPTKYGERPIYKTYTKDFSKQVIKDHLNTNNDSELEDTYRINEDGYIGEIPRTNLKWEGTGTIKTKTVKYTARKDYNDFDDKYYYSEDGYSGYLNKSGRVRKFGQAGEEKTYDRENPYISEPMMGDGPDEYKPKEFDDYSGYLSLARSRPYSEVLYDGESDSKTVTYTHRSRNKSSLGDTYEYNEDGYKGTLYATGPVESFEIGGGYVSGDTVEIRTIADAKKWGAYKEYNAGCNMYWQYRGPKSTNKEGYWQYAGHGGLTYKNGTYYKGSDDGYGKIGPRWIPPYWDIVNTQSFGSYEHSMFLEKDGYRGTLKWEPEQYWERLDVSPPPEASQQGRTVEGCGTKKMRIYYTGTMKKEGYDTRDYGYGREYKGTVSTPSENYFKYRYIYTGTLYKPDTRTYRQKYEGEVEKLVGDYKGTADYQGTLTKTVIDHYETVPIEWEATVTYDGDINYVWHDYNGTATYRGEVTKLEPIIDIEDKNKDKSTWKENRKVVISLKNSVSKLPIDNSKTKFEITPISNGLSDNDIKYKTHDNICEAVFKKSGDYNCKLTISNGTITTTQDIKLTIKPDRKPIVDFAMTDKLYRDPKNNNIATINLVDGSYSPDEDIIKQRKWRYKYDSNNDGNFADENWQTIDNGNNTNPKLKVSKLGKYLVELEAIEEFGQPTIPEFVTERDRRRDNTDSKPVKQKIVEVDNICPFASFTLNQKPKTDIVFTVGNTNNEKTKNLKSKVDAYIRNKLAANGVDANITSIETSTITSQTSFPWRVYNLNRTGLGSGDGQFRANGNNFEYKGYGSEAPIDHLYYDDGQNCKREFTFDIDMHGYDACATVIPGFIFGANDTNGFKGYIALMWHDKIRVYYFNTSHSDLTKDGPGNIARGRLCCDFEEITNVSTRNTNLVKSFKMVYKNKKLQIYDNGKLLTTVDCPNAVGNGYGIAAANSSHGCGQRSVMKFKNFQLASSSEKTFDEVIKEPDWNPNTHRFVIDLTDDKFLKNVDGNKETAILSNLLTNNISLIGLGNNSNKSEFQNFIDRNSGKGTFIDNSNMDNALSQLGDYIVQQVLQNANNSKYIVVGEKADYTTTYMDSENDPEMERKWRYIHDPNYFENSQGQASFSDKWIDNAIERFDKVGKYTVTLKAKDNPIGSDERFANYRKWSDESASEYVFYVHRRPIPQFTAVAKRNLSNNNFDVVVKEDSYDLDHISHNNKGIVEKKWRWKNAKESSWHDSMIPSSLPKDENFLIQLNVKDEDGAWSNPLTQYVTTKNINIAPIAQFEVDPIITTISNSFTIKDLSYDPNGDSISQRHWTVYKDSNKIYDSYSQPTMNDIRSHGIGKYKITLVVKDNPQSGLPLESEPYSQFLTVIPDNQPPIADFDVTPNPVPTDVDVKFKDKSHDPDGDKIVQKQWRIKNFTSNTWIYLDQPPTRLDKYGIGKVQIQLRVKDQAKYPQQKSEWSSWTEKVVNVLPGNKKPIAAFNPSPNPVPADEPVNYNDTSYDPEGSKIAEKIWTVKCRETGEVHEFHNQEPPKVYELTKWGKNLDGVGTYDITLKVRDISPNGMSPSLWSEAITKTLVVEDPLRINALTMVKLINAPKNTKLPIYYPTKQPTEVKVGYKMKFKVNTNGGDKLDIKLYANGKPLIVHTNNGDKSVITINTKRKNSNDEFEFWLDKQLPKGTIIDIKLVLTKTKLDGSQKSLVNTELGNHAIKVVGSSLIDYMINLTH